MYTQLPLPEVRSPVATYWIAIGVSSTVKRTMAQAIHVWEIDNVDV